MVVLISKVVKCACVKLCFRIWIFIRHQFCVLGPLGDLMREYRWTRTCEKWLVNISALNLCCVFVVIEQLWFVMLFQMFLIWSLNSLLVVRFFFFNLLEEHSNGHTFETLYFVSLSDSSVTLHLTSTPICFEFGSKLFARTRCKAAVLKALWIIHGLPVATCQLLPLETHLGLPMCEGKHTSINALTMHNHSLPTITRGAPGPPGSEVAGHINGFITQVISE